MCVFAFSLYVSCLSFVLILQESSFNALVTAMRPAIISSHRLKLSVLLLWTLIGLQSVASSILYCGHSQFCCRPFFSGYLKIPSSDCNQHKKLHDFMTKKSDEIVSNFIECSNYANVSLLSKSDIVSCFRLLWTRWKSIKAHRKCRPKCKQLLKAVHKQLLFDSSFLFFLSLKMWVFLNIRNMSFST